MTRFVTFATSLTVVGSSGPVGIRDMQADDDRGLFQVDSSLGNSFGIRVYATLSYDFDTNQAIGKWHDVTDRLKPLGEQDADFILVNGKYQQRKASSLGNPLDVEGIYAFGAGFFPAAIFAGVTTAPTSGHLDLHFGF